MLFKEGDIVTIREDLTMLGENEKNKHYSMLDKCGDKTKWGNTVNHVMMHFKGNKVKIDFVNQYSIQTLQGEYLPYSWTDEMFKEHEELINNDNMLLIDIIKRDKR
ncbi:MAG: hypothetical protein PHY47_12845 [Lachnospiraceae bacterium]|nr:hypothetical protein [Lachnospiraceae bacterium]